ncbi:MAG: S41 family peptidase [Acidobacteriota bacterium]|nr:S41 family peptidase [Acidobacteriota bacterium]
MIWVLVLIATLGLSSSCHGDTGGREIENLEAFTRLYGYVRFFYPGDEAAALDWNRFAVLGAMRVENSRSPAELKAALEELFGPVAPALIINKTGRQTKFPAGDATPPDPEGMKPVSWLHYGAGFGKTTGLYQSLRSNRKTVLDAPPTAFGNLLRSMDATPLRGKRIRLKAAVKTEDSQAQLWLRVDRAGQIPGLFDNMGDRPIRSDRWGYYEITGRVDDDAERLTFGCFLVGSGRIWADDFELAVWEGAEDGAWEPLPIGNPGFEEDDEGRAPKEWNTAGAMSGNYLFRVTAATAASGAKSVSIESRPIIVTAPRVKFEHIPAFGESITKDLGSGLSCSMPLVLMGSEDQTYPPAPRPELENLIAAMDREVPETLSGIDRYVRLAGTAIAWNVFRHFYPYFDVVKTDWPGKLREALQASYRNETENDFLLTLKALVAGLNDGHGRVTLRGVPSPNHYPPIDWEWIEDRLVITRIFDEALTHVRAGDIVAEINGTAAREALENKERYISAATAGWKRYRALSELKLGEKDKTFSLKIERDGDVFEKTLTARLTAQEYNARVEAAESASRMLEPGIHYLNLSVISMEDIEKLLPDLAKAKAMICDMRGYPNGNHGLIAHLLRDKENSRWMGVPRIVYPDYEQVDYHWSGWNMQPKEPSLTAKVVFITDGRAISYAESYMGYIEGFDLGVIVGQPTAGTNGNINPFELPGGYTVTWTGMRVVKHDGSQLHGVGILPDVPMERTVDGVRQGRDELLEKALEIAKNPTT